MNSRISWHSVDEDPKDFKISNILSRVIFQNWPLDWSNVQSAFSVPAADTLLRYLASCTVAKHLMATRGHCDFDRMRLIIRFQYGDPLLLASVFK